MCRIKKKRVSIYVDSESYDLIAGITRSCGFPLSRVISNVITDLADVYRQEFNFVDNSLSRIERMNAFSDIARKYCFNLQKMK
jgi:hypothetical protein